MFSVGFRFGVPILVISEVQIDGKWEISPKNVQFSVQICNVPPLGQKSCALPLDVAGTTEKVVSSKMSVPGLPSILTGSVHVSVG